MHCLKISLSNDCFTFVYRMTENIIRTGIFVFFLLLEFSFEAPFLKIENDGRFNDLFDLHESETDR